MKLFLRGPARRPPGGFTPPSRENDDDMTKAKEMETSLEALFKKKMEAEHMIKRELEEAQTPVQTREFDLMRKPAIAADPTRVLRWSHHALDDGSITV